MWCPMLERKVNICTYLPSVHSEVDFQCGWLVFSIKEILRLAVTPCSCAALLQTAICYRGLCLKFGNATRELNTKKIQAIGKLKNLTMVYKWRNIKGQVAHHSQGTWGLEGDHGLGATNLMSKSVYPTTVTAVKSVYAHHLTETNGLFLYVYRTSGELWQAQHQEIGKIQI